MAMWTCPKCQRPFRRAGQWHVCSEKTIDEIFAGKPDQVVMAFDDVLVATAEWEPNLITPARHAVMFTNKRAWMVDRPMSKLLELSFFTGELLHSPVLHRSAPDHMGQKKFRHSIRLSGPGELSPEAVALMRKGYDYGNR
ncbi:hypothetical protein GGR26_002100 [Lewinella marina]|uniref:DUF5655 domain-containing protein n=1 Tax=Neolewinella marina TaxID=438751 RepID=A0A2G0CGW2_9BACT|nr:DUF5655 domain-containing protein [Neolewinella marina]NJB86332.1 hypothetical protein [Neolewinella marina]PHK99198.1 hypothetical protein CGL56_06995 [Neolewinella marina]